MAASTEVKDVVTDFIQKNEDFTLIEEEEYVAAGVKANGEMYMLTNHAIERFQQRANRQIRELFPHLNLKETNHAIFAMATMISEGLKGKFSKKSRPRGRAVFYRDWLFVYRPHRIDGREMNMVVTCYEKGRGVRFHKYADDQ